MQYSLKGSPMQAFLQLFCRNPRTGKRETPLPTAVLPANGPGHRTVALTIEPMAIAGIVWPT